MDISDFEKYISGVVMAEGGTGKDLEYFKKELEKSKPIKKLAKGKK